MYLRDKLTNLEKDFTLSKAAFIIAGFTLLTKFFAFYRLRVFGATFGQDKILDTYYSAFRIPDIITNLFVLSTLSIAFLPIFTEQLTKSKEKAFEMANTVLNASVLTIGFLCLVLLIFSEPLTKWLVPGFSPEYFTQTLNLSRLMLIPPVLFAISTVLGGTLNSQKQFFITSFAPILYTLGVISGAKFFYPSYGIIGLGYGVILGAVAQVTIQLITAIRFGFSFKPKINLKTEAIKKFFRLYLPRILAFDLIQVTLLLGTIIGSKLAEGSITALNQAYDLQSVPIGIFAYSIALASFPVFSELYALKKEKEFLEMLLKTIRQVLFFIIPLSILMLLFRAYGVRLVLGFGKFSWEDTITTFTILGVFSFSLWSQSLTTLLSRAFFARQNTRTPVFINILSIVLNICLTFWFTKMWGIYGLTSAFCIASTFNALLLFTILRRTSGRALASSNPSLTTNFDKNLVSSLLKITCASLVMGVVGYACIYLIEPLVDTRTVLGILIQAGVSGSTAVGVYIVVGKLLKLQESEMALDFVKKFLYSIKNFVGVGTN